MSSPSPQTPVWPDGSWSTQSLASEGSWSEFCSSIAEFGSDRMHIHRGQSKPWNTLHPKICRTGEIADYAHFFGIPPEKIEQRMLDDYRREYAHFAPPHELLMLGRGLQRLMLMQHYGAPTRLLDWTGSVWIAAFFACIDNHEEDGFIWSFSPYAFQGSGMSYAPKSLAARFDGFGAERFGKSVCELEDGIAWVMPHYHLARSHAQQSSFTISTRFEHDHASIIARFPGCQGKRLRIPARVKPDILRLLQSMNVRRSTLFPGAEGLAIDIADQAKHRISLAAYELDESE